jgi:hypothetical protein
MDGNESERVAAYTVRQSGLITRAQAFDAGLTRHQVDHRLRAGRWEVERPGVYGLVGVPPSERRTVLAACLSSGAIASHATAARLWWLDLPSPDLLEVVTMEDRRVRLPGVRQHRTTTIVRPDVAALGPLRLTSVPRTLVDCAGRVRPDRLGAVVDDALRRGLVQLGALRACHVRVDTGPGRRPTVAMRDVLAEREPGHAPGDSIREADLLATLTAAGLPVPVLGHRVRIGRRTYKLDLAWPELRIALEFDSWEHHRTFTAFHHDRQRNRRIEATGWHVLPVTSKTDLDELIAELWSLIRLSGHLTATGAVQ